MAGKRSCLVRLTGTRMSQTRDVNSYPDGYRVLSSSELRSSFKMKKKLIRSCDSVKRYFFVSHTHFRALTDCFFARLSFFSLNNCTFYQNCAVDYSIHLQSSDLCSMLYALHAIVIAYIHPVLYTALHTIALQASYKDSYT